MKVQPDGAELLRVARAELLEDLLPHLPPARHYAARMVANAMAIAAREMKSRPWGIGEAGLAAEIRAGRHDDSPATLEALTALTRARLEISNPRVLEALP